jgi:hypothetical protein
MATTQTNGPIRSGGNFLDKNNGEKTPQEALPLSNEQVLLHPDQHHRVVLAGILAGDIVQPLRADCRSLVAVMPAPDRLDNVAVIVPEEGRQVV